MMTPFRRSLEATTKRLDQVLAEHRFVGGIQYTEGGAFRRWWVRDVSWKSDVVEMVYRRGAELSLPINLMICLPVPSANGIPRAFDGRGLVTADIPRIAARWRSLIYGRRVARIVLTHLGWFDQFGTPEQCLARLGALDHQGPRAGATLELMVAHLQGVARARSA